MMSAEVDKIAAPGRKQAPSTPMLAALVCCELGALSCAFFMRYQNACLRPRIVCTLDLGFSTRQVSCHSLLLPQHCRELVHAHAGGPAAGCSACLRDPTPVHQQGCAGRPCSEVRSHATVQSPAAQTPPLIIDYNLRRSKQHAAQWTSCITRSLK